nr:zinc finger, CCHC-type, Gag-polypeptide of LTR copia-type [Tanacetum cinerariifolium]
MRNPNKLGSGIGHSPVSRRSNYRGNSFCGHDRRLPHCQLCRLDGHYASSCPNLSNYAQKSSYAAANITQAFHADCNINEYTPDWYVDSSATAHMALSSTTLKSSVPYHGNEKVSFGNGNVLPVSRIGTLSINQNLKLQDVLIVPNIKKTLLSVSKLTNDYPVDFLFSRSFFAIQDSATKAILS